MIKSLYIELYYTQIIFAIDTTKDEWDKFRKKYKKYITEEDEQCFLDDLNSPKTCNGSTIQLDCGAYLVFVRNKDAFGDLAHEIFHVCNRILVERGFTHDEKAEPWAYLIGYVTDKVYEKLDNN